MVQSSSVCNINCRTNILRTQHVHLTYGDDFVTLVRPQGTRLSSKPHRHTQ